MVIHHEQCIFIIRDVLRELVSFVQFKKRENTHEGVLLLIKMQVYPATKSNTSP